MYLDYLGTLNAVASILTRGVQGNPDRREQGLAKAEAETEATWPNDQDARGGAGATKSGSGQEGPSSGAFGRSALPMPGFQATRGWVWVVLITFFI